MFEKLVVKKAMNPDERISQLIDPINRVVGEQSVIFNFPGSRQTEDGEQIWDDPEYDIKISNESDIVKIEQVLSNQGLLEISTIIIRADL